MTRYDIGPYFVKLRYTSGGHNHVMQFSVKPVGSPTVGEPFDVETKAGTPISLSAAIGAIVAKMVPLIPTGSGVNSWDAYYKEAPTAQPVWMNGGQIVGGSGTNTEAAKVAGQVTITFRSSLGHHFRLQFMETPAQINQVMDVSYLSSGAWGDLVDVFMDENSVVRARDGGKLVSVIRGVTKINDKLRRAYLI